VKDGEKDSIRQGIPSQAVGSAGELIVQARLLMRGWVAGNANSGGMMNAPAVDLFAAKGDRTLRIAVKATGPGSKAVQWNAPFGWESLFKGDIRPHFVIFVWFHNRKRLDECRIFVVPADVVDDDVRNAHNHWHSHPKKDGSPHKEGRHVAIGWLGKDTLGNIANGFAEKWKQYEDNWSLLEP
jgi:hypothetical protein